MKLRKKFRNAASDRRVGLERTRKEREGRGRKSDQGEGLARFGSRVGEIGTGGSRVGSSESDRRTGHRVLLDRLLRGSLIRWTERSSSCGSKQLRKDASERVDAKSGKCENVGVEWEATVDEDGYAQSAALKGSEGRTSRKDSSDDLRRRKRRLREP